MHRPATLQEVEDLRALPESGEPDDVAIARTLEHVLESLHLVVLHGDVRRAGVLRARAQA